ncbi:MAG: multiple sugar transport system permease protein [Thermomicrobiales bacterium]|jgi:multiple sugar transport system permease protein|nr:multiple sugar transport system permease protein [Thermomicrobiales bacterium]MEA2585882.1 multiple sugar transport system permease protein [Thermomicrobiales bacterium]
MATVLPRPTSVPTARGGARHRGRQVRRVGYYLLVLFVVVVTFFPIYWMVLSAIQPTKYSTRYPPPFIPKGIDFQAFRTLFDKQPIVDWLIRSVYLAGIATVICISLSILGAYALSSMRWRGRNAFAIFLLMTQMLPEALIIVPIFRIFTDFPIIHRDLRNSIPALALIHAAFILPICVWVLKNMFDTVPREVREAGLVDGAGPMRVLFQIVIPLVLPGLVAVGVIAFFYAWNEYLFAQLLITDKSLFPASVGLGTMRTMLDTPIEQLLAAGMLFSIPPVIFYVVMQRYIVAGISAGAVKG